MKITRSGKKESGNIISIVAPARLHLGFIDMHGGLGRNFGSLGVSLADIYTHVRVTPSRDVIIQGPSSNRASVYAGRMLKYLNIDKGVSINIHETIPEHAGLGSGTQLSLAIGTAIANLYNHPVNIHDIACIMGRGARSGIGIGAFSMGGFLVDGGKGGNTEVPPIISHLRFPEAWRFVLIFDQAMQGVNGLPEKEAFNKLPPMDVRKSEYLCRLTLMQVLPALVEVDYERFGSAISEIQEVVGDHFANVQGGRFSSEPVAGALNWFREQGAAGIGQSSWGPTGFALFDNETRAYQLLKKARSKWQSGSRLSFKVCRAKNQRAEITSEDISDKKLQLKNQ